MPQEHSAEIYETFYYNDEVVLRTQTSPVQVRVMMDEKPPLRVISRVAFTVPMKSTRLVHRCSIQMEGLVIDKGITMADLKEPFMICLQKLFGETVQTKFAASVLFHRARVKWT